MNEEIQRQEYPQMKKILKKIRTVVPIWSMILFLLFLTAVIFQFLFPKSTALANGNVELAERMLGREYTVTAPVIGGRRLGRKWGFPTVNQHFFDGAAVPQRGVYASSCVIDGKKYGAVTNIGVRPTVSGGRDAVTAETHIFGFSGDLYGKTLDVALKHFIRPEKTFENGEELKKAVLADIETAREYCSKNIL